MFVMVGKVVMVATVLILVTGFLVLTIVLILPCNCCDGFESFDGGDGFRWL
jgi:hypothetical protein